MADARENEELVHALVHALRRSLTESCEDHERMARAADAARACAAALYYLDGAGADTGARRAALLAGIYGVPSADIPALLDDAAAGRPRPGRPDAAVDLKALEALLAGCAADVEAVSGVPVRGDPVAHFLSGAHRGPPEVRAVRVAQAPPLAGGIRVSVAALACTVVALVALLVYLSISFARGVARPVTQVLFRAEERLRVPVVTFCPGVRGVPLFPAGAAGAGVSVAGERFSAMPLFTVTGVEVSGGDARAWAYPEAVEEVADVVRLAAKGRGAPAVEGECGEELGEMSAAVLGGALADGGGVCATCLRVGVRTPFVLSDGHGAGEEQALRVRLSVNRLFDHCIFPGQRLSQQRLLLTFASLMAGKVEALRDGGFLTDPGGTLGLDAMSSSGRERQAEVVALLADFRKGTDQPHSVTDYRRLETDLFCNAVFMSGLWYPLAGNSSMASIAFVWDDEIKYFRRAYPDNGLYWDTDGAVHDGEGGAANPQVRTSGWDVFAEDASMLQPGVVSRSAFIGAVDQSTVATFRLRRKRDLDSSVDIAAPVVMTSTVIPPKGLETLYRGTTFDFKFDRYLTEELRQEVSYLPHQYVIDLANAVNLFLGVSVHSLLIAPVSLYIHARLSRRR